MNVKALLELEKPIPFHNICNIYPISVYDLVIHDEDNEYSKIFLPYIISKESLDSDVNIFDLLMSNDEYRKALVESIKVFTHEENVITVRDMLLRYAEDNESYCDILEGMFQGYDDVGEFLQDKNYVVINNNKYLTSELFDEFASIVRLMQEIKISKPKEEPKFKTEEGRKRWLDYQESKKKFEDNDKTMSIENIINIVQFGGNSYIPSETILNWSKWKLMNAYTSILKKDGYEKSFTAVTNGCTNDGSLGKHWSELLKVT